ncbi:hypothetical protein MTO96_022647 [Rhipicephalus appendiculatus]
MLDMTGGMFATVLLGLASYAAAGGFTAPSAYAASVYGPAIGSVGYGGHGGRGYLPQAYNLQVSPCACIYEYLRRLELFKRIFIWRVAGQ